MELSCKIGYVYQITSPSNRHYIGSSITPARRWTHYYNKSCKHQIKLYNSFCKYGVDTHEFKIIWIGKFEDMYKMERTFGIKYDVITVGLNCSLPGYDEIPGVLSEESKLKLSISQKKRTQPDEVKKKISDSLMGRKRPSNIGIKTGAALKKRCTTLEYLTSKGLTPELVNEIFYELHFKKISSRKMAEKLNISKNDIDRIGQKKMFSNFLNEENLQYVQIGRKKVNRLYNG